MKITSSLIKTFFLCFGMLVFAVENVAQENEVLSKEELVAKKQNLKNSLGSGEWLTAQTFLEEIATHYNNTSEWDSIYEYKKQLIEVAKKNGDLEAELVNLGNIVAQDFFFSRNKDQYSTKIRYMVSMLDTNRLSDRAIGYIYHSYSKFLYDTGNVDSSIIIGFKALRYEDRAEISPERIIHRIELAKNLQSVKQLENGLLLLLEAENIESKTMVMPVAKIRLYKNIADILQKIDDLEKATYYIEKAHNVAIAEGYQTFKADVELIWGRILMKSGKIDEGFEKLKSALHVFRDKKMAYKQKYAHFYIAESLFEAGRVEETKKYIDSTIFYGFNNAPAFKILEAKYNLSQGNTSLIPTFFDQIKDRQELYKIREGDVLDVRYRYHKAIGDKDKALFYHEQYKFYQDSVYKSNQAIITQRIENEFNRKQKDVEIKALIETNIAQDRALAFRNGLLLMGGLTLLLLGGLLFGLYRLYVKNQENQIKLSAQNVRITEALEQNQILMKEIHHRVKNNLQVISSLLSMQARKVTDSDTKDALNSSRTRVQSMSLLHQNLYQGDQITEANVANYLEEMVRNIVNTYNIDEGIELDIDIEDISLDVDTLLPLGLVANELICNALKYAFVGIENGKLTVSLNKVEGDTLRLIVKDNGIGMPDNKIPSKKGSLGSRLINLFTERLEGNLKIDGSEGTEVIIEFKKPSDME